MNNIISFNDEKCTSCQVCAAVCPTNAISIYLNENGFYRPSVNSEKCISCGKCRRVCYKFDNSVSMSDECKAVYACKGETDILSDVTSGGVAYLLAKQAVSEGYKVVGVTYDKERNIAVSEITDIDVERFKGSKYIQSYTVDVFRKILSEKTDTRYMIFGLPCHIYALRKVINGSMYENNFVFVDLFCHGCPSMLLWEKTLKKAEDVLGTDEFKKVEFRSKKKGWHEFCVNFETNEKKVFISDEFGAFYRLFFSNLILNNVCEDCKLRSTLAYTDIRLGDFWGWQYDEDITGVSAVTAVSDVGYEWLQKLPKNIFITEHSMSDVIRCQSYGEVYEVDKQKRRELLELLKSDVDIDEIQKTFEKSLPLKAKIKKYIKKAISFMPGFLRNSIKKGFHRKG